MATQFSDPETPTQAKPDIRFDWTRAEAQALLDLPFNDLLFRAQSVHRRHFDANEVQLSTLLNIKDGGCPEDCKYCAQSARYETDFKAKKLMEREAVLARAREAKDAGAQRFCMGAAWRSPKDHELDAVCDMIGAVKALGLETCATLGMVDLSQAQRLKEAGLDYYNHNLDTSEEYYGEVITTRSYRDRLDTLASVREAGMKVCCGGILGMGEGVHDRAALLTTLACLDPHPESVPINMLIAIEGTPYADLERIDPIDFVRNIAAARIMMPGSMVRFAAGRHELDAPTQALAFLAGANSIFYGEKLLTTPNPEAGDDKALMDRLGLKPMSTPI
jgi:biotin synthase